MDPTGPPSFPGRASWTPPTRPRPVPRSRPALHLLLLAASFLTLAAAGGLSWEQATEIPSTLGLLEALGWLATHPAIAWDILLRGTTYATWVIAILGAHEMGHYVACRRHGIRATLPFFVPGVPPIGTFGAVIRIRSPIPTRDALFDVAAAGPVAGFFVAVPALAWGLATAEPVAADAVEGVGLFLGQPLIVVLLQSWLAPGSEHFFVNSVFVAGWVGVLVTSLNLFPVGQLDGGHAAYALSRRVHRLVARVTLGAMLGVILLQVASGQFPSYLLWFGVLLWMRDRHPRLVDESRPLSRGRRLLAVGLLVMFVVCFILFPFYVG